MKYTKKFDDDLFLTIEDKDFEKLDTSFSDILKIWILASSIVIIFFGLLYLLSLL